MGEQSQSKGSLVNALLIPSGFPNEFMPFGDYNFSFKKENKDEKLLRIYTYPESLVQNFDNERYQHMISFNELISKVPSITIREYNINPRIEQIINCFKAFKKGLDDAAEFARQNKKTSISELFDLLPGKLKEQMERLTTNSINTKDVTWGSGNTSILDIPFIMYYQMMTAKNTGIYTIPFSGKIIDESDGQNGWNGDSGSFKTSNESILGNILNFLGANIKFHTTPTWQGSTDNKFSSIDVQFDLINTTKNAAINNFLFVQTLIAKNKYLQYHIFQQNPCVYDIKIQGYNRFFMCSAKMKVEYKGVSRVPQQSMIDEILKYAPNFKNKEKMKEYINIPDVYSLTLSFQPLLPNSVNNYIYKYIANTEIEHEIDRTSDIIMAQLSGFIKANEAAGKPIPENVFSEE